MAGMNSEIESFFMKFKTLLYSGFHATLTMESNMGEAFVCLKAGLGSVNVPSSSESKVQPYQKSKHRSPSYRRRQERRRKSFEASRETTGDAKSSASDVIDSDDATIKNETGDDFSVVEENQHIAGGEYACNSCDFKSKWENGLLIHKSSAHDKKATLKSAEEQLVFDLTQRYRKTGILEKSRQFYINALIDVEQSNVSDAIMVDEESKLQKLWNDGNSSPS